MLPRSDTTYSLIEHGLQPASVPQLYGAIGAIESEALEISALAVGALCSAK